MEGAVVMGCDEPLARGGGAVERVGVVWFGANRACWRAFRHGQVCYWRAGGRRGCHGVVTSGAKHGGTEGDTLRRFLQISGRGGTAGTGKHGLTLTGGQVVAGSNPVSPTKEVAGERRFRSPPASPFVVPGGGMYSNPIHIPSVPMRPSTAARAVSSEVCP
jgi:hypothetical protein